MCLTCSSHSCGGNRDIRPLQTEVDIRTRDPGDSQTPVPVIVSFSALGSPGAILITFFTVCKDVTRQSLFSLEHLRFSCLVFWFGSCIVVYVHISLIFPVFIVFALPSYCLDHCPMFIVHCFLFIVFIQASTALLCCTIETSWCVGTTHVFLESFVATA